MATFTVGSTLNEDGSITENYFADNSNIWQTSITDPATVQSDIQQWANKFILSNNGAGTSPGHVIGTYGLIVASLGVKEGVVTASQLYNWANTYNVQVSEIPVGANTVGQPGNSTQESFFHALYDSNASNAPSLESDQFNAALSSIGSQTIASPGDYLKLSGAALSSVVDQFKTESTVNANGAGPNTISTANPLAVEVQEAYLAYYGRPADAAGQSYWVNQLAGSGGNIGSIIAAFGNSAESQALYGNGTPIQVVTQIYNQLFGRAPDQGGLNFWVGQIQSGAISPASAALAILQGATGQDKVLLTDKLVLATAFSGILSSDSQANSQYSGNTAASNARTLLSVVDSNASATPHAIASQLNNIIHDIQGSISADLAGIGVSIPSNITLVGASTSSATLIHA